MLENSELISGKQAKQLEELCEAYNDVSLQINDLTVIKKSVGNDIKAICEHAGTFETTNYCVKMQQVKDKIALDMKLVEEYLKANYPVVYEEIQAQCVKLTEGYLKFGSVTRKGKRV